MEKQIQENRMAKEPSLSSVLPVQILTMLISVTAMFIDSIIIGKYLHDDALAAYGLTTPVTLLITALGGMIGNGVQVTAGEYAGAANKKGLDKILSSSVTGGAAISTAVLVITVLFSRQLAILLGAETDAVISLTSDYLTGIAFCFPMIVLVLTVPTFMQMKGGRKHLVVSAFLMIFLDVALDLLNVKVFDGGMFGMAMASTVSYYISALYLFISFFRKSEYSFSIRSVSIKAFKTILTYGLLYLTYKLCQVFMGLSINYLLLNKGGEALVAANAIITSVNLVTGAFPSGFGSTSTMLGSYYYGMGDMKKISAFIKKTVLVSIAVNGIVAIITILSARPVTQVFAPESEVIYETAVFGLRLFSLSLVFNSINYIIKNVSQSVKNIKRSYLICLLNDLALPIMAALVILYIFPVKWLWLCYTVGQGLTMVIVFVLLKADREDLWNGKQ